MRLRYRKCPRCGQRSHRNDWWNTVRPVTHSTGPERIAGTSTANAHDYAWTRSGHALWIAVFRSSKSVIITCPQCGSEVTVREGRREGFW